MIRRRQKASDVLRESTPLLGKRTSSFSKAFPDIEDIEVMTTEEGNLGERVRQYKRTLKYTKVDFPGEYADCSNPLCYNGGVEIGSLVSRMVRNQQRELKESRDCRGYEGSPKGKKYYGPCDNHFEITVNITYRPADHEK